MNRCRKQNYGPFSNSLLSWHLSRPIIRGGGDFVSFFSTQGPSFALKRCPRGGDFDGKN